MRLKSQPSFRKAFALAMISGVLLTPSSQAGWLSLFSSSGSDKEKKGKKENKVQVDDGSWLSAFVRFVANSGNKPKLKTNGGLTQSGNSKQTLQGLTGTTFSTTGSGGSSSSSGSVTFASGTLLLSGSTQAGGGGYGSAGTVASGATISRTQSSSSGTPLVLQPSPPTESTDTSGYAAQTLVMNGVNVAGVLTLINQLTLQSGSSQVPAISTASGSISIHAGTLTLSAAIPANTRIFLASSATLKLGNVAAVAAPLHFYGLIHASEPGTAFSETNPVSLITDSPAGAEFPNDTAIQVTPFGATETQAGTIINNTGVALRIQPSTLISGGLMILAPSAE